jgi:UDP-4-amino-4,6-dideoxy-N-acetyl-beta-L-altrosamine N-acetyltransferase
MDRPFRLRPVVRDDLDMVRRWRNQPEVRRNALTQHEIGAEEHEAFYARVWSDPSKQYFICLDGDGVPVGVVGFFAIDPHHRTASWSFFSGDLARRGIGTWMAYLALEQAFGPLDLAKLWGEVLAWNPVGVRFHQKFGFALEGTYRAHYLRDDQRYDVHRIGILRHEWEARRPDIERMLRGRSHDLPPLQPGEQRSLSLASPGRDVRGAPDGRVHGGIGANGGDHDRGPGALVAAVVTALTDAYAGPGTALERLEVHLADGAPGPPAGRLQVTVTRRVGPHVTVALALDADGSSERAVRGAADLRLSEEGS